MEDQPPTLATKKPLSYLKLWGNNLEDSFTP